MTFRDADECARWKLLVDLNNNEVVGVYNHICLLGVSLRFGDILSEKQCSISLRLHEKAFGNQKFPRGWAPRPLHSIFFVKFQNPHLTEKLDSPLWIMKNHMIWNYVLLGYRLKTTYMTYQGHLKVKLAEILKIYTFTYLQPC